MNEAARRRVGVHVSAMKKLLLLLALGATAFAGDQLRNAQMELKSQGFYYGDSNGEATAETTAAIRRYQIRNGLEVTGQLSKETLDALGLGGTPKPAPPVAAPEPPAPPPPPPVNLRRDETTEESDRAFLRREENKAQQPPPPPPPRDDPAVVAPPAPIPAEATYDYSAVFTRTPYASAPPEVQEQTVRRAQTLLAQRGFYRAPVDGAPGPATEEALVNFQRRTGLQVTGRLDLATLNALRLLPGRTPIKPFYPSPQAPDTRVYRGVIVE